VPPAGSRAEVHSHKITNQLTTRLGRTLASLVYCSETNHLLQPSRAFSPAAVTCDRRRFPKLRPTMRSIPHHALSLHPAGGKVFPPAGFFSDVSVPLGAVVTPASAVAIGPESAAPECVCYRFRIRLVNDKA
jgi:hypothetical protein